MPPGQPFEQFRFFLIEGRFALAIKFSHASFPPNISSFVRFFGAKDACMSRKNSLMAWNWMRRTIRRSVPAVARKPESCLPRCEQLEDRVMPAANQELLPSWLGPDGCVLRFSHVEASGAA